MKPDSVQQNPPELNLQRRSPLLLWIWLSLGTALRLFNLQAKPPWTDEFATLMFSRGDHYSNIPLNQSISPETLLAPLKGYPDAGLAEVAAATIQYDNHPPLYFMVLNLWQRLFPLDQSGYISIGAARLLSVILGVLGIWGLYWVAKQTFQSEAIAQLSAAMMALSPFGIYLSQEARQYTLIVLFVIASLGFSLRAVQLLFQNKTPAPVAISGWILLHCVGLLVHYFFVLTIAAEVIALVWLTVQTKYLPNKAQWLSGLGCLVGVGIFGLIWFTQVLPDSYGSTMTDWIRLDGDRLLDWLSPIVLLPLTVMTMLMLLPLTIDFIPITIVVVVTLFFLSIHIISLWWQGLQLQALKTNYRVSIGFLTRYVLSSWGIFALLTYGFGISITRGARYSFIYFPALILLMAVGLSYFWQKQQILFLNNQTPLHLPGISLTSGSRAVVSILAVMMLGSLMVLGNWGYQKPYRPDQFVTQLMQQEKVPTLIVTPHKSIVQTGEMIGIAWEMYQRSLIDPVQFILVSQIEDSPSITSELKRILAQQNTSFSLWAVNFGELLNIPRCKRSDKVWVRGYYTEVYRCFPSQSNHSSEI